MATVVIRELVEGHSCPQRSVIHIVTDQLPSQVNYLAFGALLGSEILTNVRCHGENSRVAAEKVQSSLVPEL